MPRPVPTTPSPRGSSTTFARWRARRRRAPAGSGLLDRPRLPRARRGPLYGGQGAALAVCAVSADPSTAGVLLVDKPAGVTSHDVVARVRAERSQRTGHAGTLDPFATGLLVVLVGRPATRCQSRFMALPKTYRAVARFGAVSTTGDPEGDITETGVLPPDSLPLPTGLILQRPPAYSAVKV